MFLFLLAVVYTNLTKIKGSQDEGYALQNMISFLSLCSHYFPLPTYLPTYTTYNLVEVRSCK